MSDDRGDGRVIWWPDSGERNPYRRYRSSLGVFVDESGRRMWAGRIVLSLFLIGALLVLGGGLWPLIGRPGRVNASSANLDPALSAPSPFPLNLNVLRAAGDQAAACASITGEAYFDFDLNGARGVGEPPVPGIAVTAFGPGNVTLASTVTRDDGRFAFDFAAPSPVRLEFESPGGRYVEGPSGVDSDWRVSFPRPPACEAVMGVNWRGNFATATTPTRMEIGGRIWRDENCDSLAQPTEPAQRGIIVRLLDAEGGRLAEVTTDAAGRYAFGGIEAATAYRLVVQAPRGVADAPDTFRFTAGPSLYGTRLVTVNADGSASITIAERGHSEHGIDVAADPDGGCSAKSPGSSAPKSR